MENNSWVKVTDGTTIGYKIIKKFPMVRTPAMKISIDESLACPVIANIELFRAPGN